MAIKILFIAEFWWVFIGLFRFLVLDKDENPAIYCGPLILTLLSRVSYFILMGY